MAVQVGTAGESSKSAGPSTFRVYYTPPTDSKKSGTSAIVSNLKDEDEEAPVVFVCHHGAGYSAMSFALLSKELAENSGGKAGVLALDCRGHGESECCTSSWLLADNPPVRL